MPLIPFPSVPKLPGVPSLPRSNAFPPIVKAGLGILQGALWRVFQVETQWGIFDSSGNALADPAIFTGLVGSALEAAGIGTTMSTNSVTYTKETRVSDFPIEQGGFASYNKVELPANPIVTLCLTGTEANRTSFLDAIDAACKSTDLFSVVTPEVTYVDYAVERYNYERRSNKGATMLIVEIALREIRQVSAQFAQSEKGEIDSPKDAGAAPTADAGKVQSSPPAKSTLKSAAEKLGF